MKTENQTALVPEATPPLDLIAVAIAKLGTDAGAVFTPDALELLRQVRKADPAGWARYRQAIKASNAVSMADLDRLTTERTSARTESADQIFPEVVLWPDPVDGSQLLADVATIIRRHVIADKETIHAAALWVAFTWFIDVVDVAPIANVTAPEKRCGKSVLLGTLARLACRPLTVSNIAPAALFRSLELWQPTLLIDEIDTFLSEHEEARGILNAGFTRDSAFVIRCTGDDHTPTPFNVWGAKALCGIGKIADTLQDRSIPLRLRRKLAGEETVKIRHADKSNFAELVGKLARFAIDNRESVRVARPAEIEGLNDRANDCWEPLLAVAESAGGDWPGLARKAAVTLHGLEEEAPSADAELLADIKTAFAEKYASKIFSADLLQVLISDEEAPWATWNRGKPFTQRQLTARLSGYAIKSKDIRQGLNVRKGFSLDQFADAFERYLSPATPPASATPLQPSNNAGLSVAEGLICSATETPFATLKATAGAGCSGVADKIGVQGKSADQNQSPMWRATV
jgi:hypothetical protein